MEHVYEITLLFVTLLQLCRAELSGTWYAANVINDGDFSPKPISEIFSTSQSPFSPTNPIVVLPSSTTASHPISTSFPPTFSTFSSSFSTASLASEEYASTPPSTIPTRSTYVPSAPTQPPFVTTFNDGKPLFDVQPFPFPVPQDKPSNGPPNYFLIYQQAPQTVQNLPPTAPQQTFSTSQPPTGFESSTFRPDISTPQTTLSTFRPEVFTPSSTFSTLRPEISSPQTTFSTFRPEISTPETTWSTFRPETSTPSTFGTFRPSSLPTVSSRPQTSSISTTFSPDPTRTTRTIPCDNGAVTSKNSTIPLSPRFPTLRIRMVAPSGSITNINVNPSVATTTKRPVTRRTTTRKPTTTRTKRTKKGRNSFDGCTNMCQGRKPICAIPLAQAPIDPDKLKGFPSICHMACHNSFKKDQYEMLVDGRCGKLRTRIKTVDSNKLKRVELNKAQYTIVDQNPQTVLEFSALPRK